MEVCAFQLPGREGRYREPAFVRAREAAEEVARRMTPWLYRPYALFGHSMGALLSFEIARALRRRGQPLPFLMLLSAYLAPQLPRRQPPVRDLPCDQLLARLREMNGTPDAVLRNRELMEFLMPTIRADFEICETYQYQPEPPLEIPLIVFGGQEDAEVGVDLLEGWRVQTAASFRREMLPGDHFFLHSSKTPLLQLVAEALRTRCAASAVVS